MKDRKASKLGTLLIVLVAVLVGFMLFSRSEELPKAPGDIFDEIEGTQEPEERETYECDKLSGGCKG